jgi:hypothetical protein
VTKPTVIFFTGWQTSISTPSITNVTALYLTQVSADIFSFYRATQHDAVEGEGRAVRVFLQLLTIKN